MLPFGHLKRTNLENVNPPSKRFKKTQAALSLHTDDLKRLSKTACAREKDLARQILWESMLECEELKKQNSHTKNDIVEATIDSELGQG